MTINAWQQVVAALEAEGISLVFGLPGSPRHLYDVLYDAESVRPLLVRHETSGAFMAMAYARVSGGVGCFFGSPGPGMANLVPDVLEAYSGCTPVLALSVRASTRTEGLGTFQETDQIGLMKPITKRGGGRRASGSCPLDHPPRRLDHHLRQTWPGLRRNPG